MFYACNYPGSNAIFQLELLKALGTRLAEISVGRGITEGQPQYTWLEIQEMSGHISRWTGIMEEPEAV